MASLLARALARPLALLLRRMAAHLERGRAAREHRNRLDPLGACLGRLGEEGIRAARAEHDELGLVIRANELHRREGDALGLTCRPPLTVELLVAQRVILGEDVPLLPWVAPAGVRRSVSRGGSREQGARSGSE